jgi:hypothetical protein
MAAEKSLNIDEFIEEINLVTRNSAKTGNDYKVIQIVLNNGLKWEFFPESAYAAILQMLIDGARDKKEVDKA